MISQEQIINIIVKFIREETGYTKEATFGIGFDEFFIRSREELDESNIRITFNYSFEEDGFSQYPKCHGLEGYFILDVDGNILDWFLEEVYTGPASTLAPYKQKENKA